MKKVTFNLECPSISWDEKEVDSLTLSDLNYLHLTLISIIGQKKDQEKVIDKINQDHIFETNTNNARTFVNKINEIIYEVNKLKLIIKEK